MSGVRSEKVSRAFASPPVAASASTTAGASASAAKCIGVTPVVVYALGSAPASRRIPAIAASPERAARWSGVYPPSRVVERTVAPA